MPQREAKERIKDFEEVNFGYNKEHAISEAKRCIQCKKPLCMEGCPVEINIPEMIKHIAQEDFLQAVITAKDKNSLPAICGRVCPQETQCEKFCILGKKGKPVAIGHLERFVADWGADQGQDTISDTSPGKKGAKIAVVGSGPAGLTCAANLAKMGYQATIFESLSDAGGVLRYGIPAFRLSRDVVDREIEYVKELGVRIDVNMLIGQIKSINDLFDEGYKAIFIGTGAGLPRFMDIPGENLNGVYSANEFLTRINLLKAYRFPEYDTPVTCGRKVAVIGAGNVAVDSARSALRLGAEEVSIVYRRSKREMPARDEEIEHAKEEGVKFHLLTLPVEIYSNGKGSIRGMRCIKMELGEPDDSGRRRPVPVKGSDFDMDVDTLVVAIGQNPNPLLPALTPDLEIGRWGNVVIDPDTMKTSIKGVFAGGDIATGAATVIEAMGAGKHAARSIHEFLKKRA
ncbi:MAG: NADPH-dependent glutamate synthase [bacterium]